MTDNTSIDTKFDDFAKHYRLTLRRTDTVAYRDAIDGSKNEANYLAQKESGRRLEPRGDMRLFLSVKLRNENF